MPRDVLMEREVACDRCGWVQTPVLKMRPKLGGGEDWFWHCSKCHGRHNVATLTQRGTRIVAEIAAVRADRHMDEADREAELHRLDAELVKETTNDVRLVTD